MGCGARLNAMYSNQTAIYLLVLLAAIACIRLLVSRGISCYGRFLDRR